MNASFKTSFLRLFFAAAFLACANMVNAQLPNEKFGKPSNLEWDFNGWGDAFGADAVILCKTMTVRYHLSDQVLNNNASLGDVSFDNLADFSKNQIDNSDILVKYEIKLRTKILKPDGAKHANIDITLFNSDEGSTIYTDELEDLNIKVFTKNEKGKVQKRNVDTRNFARERIDKNYEVLHVVVPNVEAGSIVEYQYKITSVRPHYIYDWSFQESIPTVRSKCDIQIPAFFQFNMNAPINKLIKSSVEADRITYDANRADLKRSKSCVCNHYTIVGDYILPEGQELTRNQNGADGDKEAEKIGVFTSRINMPNVTHPAYMPEGCTHLRVK